MTSTSPHIVMLGSSGFAGAALMAAFCEKLGQEKVAGLNSSDLDLVADGAAKRLAGRLDENSILIVASRARTSKPFGQFTDEIAMTLNVAKALAEHAIKKCVYISTISVYDDTKTDLAIDESKPVHPASLYGIGKYSSESLLRITCEKCDIPFLVFRPCKIYGPGDPSNAYGPTSFARAALAGETISVYGDGLELRDHLYIEDLTNAVLPLTLSGETGVFNLANGASHNFMRLLALVREAVGKDICVNRKERTRPKIDQGINMHKLRLALPDWQPTPADEGIRRYVQSLMGKEG